MGICDYRESCKKRRAITKAKPILPAHASHSRHRLFLKQHTLRLDGRCLTFVGPPQLKALPQKSLWVTGSGERFPTLDEFLELSFGLLNRTSMKPERGSVYAYALAFLQELVMLHVGDGGSGFG